MTNRCLLGAFALFAVLTAGCQNSAPASSTSEPPKTETAAKEPPVETSTEAPKPDVAVAAELKHAGFEYYGLARTEPLTYLLTRDGTAVGTGASLLTLKAGDPVKFEVTRTGSLETIGSQTIELRKDGIYTIALGGNTFEKPVLEVPADLAPGKTWTSAGKFKLSDGQSAEMNMTYKAVGVEKIKTAMGEFDGLKITSSGTLKLAAGTQKTTGTMWLAKGIGPVKTQMSIDANGAKSDLVMEVQKD